MKAHTIKSRQDVMAEFARKGVSLRSWAINHGFHPATVSQVLSGINNGSRGVGHKIAVTLGIKDGEIVE